MCLMIYIHGSVDVAVMPVVEQLMIYTWSLH